MVRSPAVPVKVAAGVPIAEFALQNNTEAYERADVPASEAFPVLTLRWLPVFENTLAIAFWACPIVTVLPISEIPILAGPISVCSATGVSGMAKRTRIHRHAGRSPSRPSGR